MYKEKYHKNSLIIRALLALVLGLFPTLKLQAQNNNTESPYSRFGIGELTSQTATSSRAMGGVGIALRSNQTIIPRNPASYAAVDSQTFIFDFATSIGVAGYREESRRNQRLLGNFEYATILFPITPWLSTSVGLIPFSSVGYKYGTVQPIPGVKDREYTTLYRGNGNISEAYLGVAVDPIKNFSLGVNLGYLFGSLAYNRSVDFKSSGALNPYTLETLALKGIHLTLGTQGIIPLNDKYELSLGATYAPSLPLNSTYIQRQTLGSPSNTQSFQTDTLSARNLYATPHTIGIGVAYAQTNRWVLAADVEYRLWQNALKTVSFYTPRNQWQAAVGFSYTPNHVSSFYWQRIAYKVGIAAENSYLTLPTNHGNKGYYKGTLSLGASLPLVDRRSFVDFSLEYALLRPEHAALVREQSIRFTLGLRFNEGWFRKIRLD